MFSFFQQDVYDERLDRTEEGRITRNAFGRMFRWIESEWLNQVRPTESTTPKGLDIYIYICVYIYIYV